MKLRENLEDYEISIGYLRMILKNIQLPEIEDKIPKIREDYVKA